MGGDDLRVMLAGNDISAPTPSGPGARALQVNTRSAPISRAIAELIVGQRPLG